MAKNIKDITNAFNVCVKAATLNKKGLISLEEGIGAEAISLIKIPHNKIINKYFLFIPETQNETV